MWYKILRKWLPDHFTGQNYNVHFQAIGGLLDDLELNLNEHIKETFISQANTPYPTSPRPRQETYKDLTFLDIHGQERGIERLNYDDQQVERDAVLQGRIRNIKYNRSKIFIINNIRSVLKDISIKIEDDYDSSFLSNTGAVDNTEDYLYGITQATKGSKTVIIDNVSYGLYGPLDWLKRLNCFSILINTKKRVPHSFYDNAFYDNNAFFGSEIVTISSNLKDVLINLIRQKAPAGAGFRLLIGGDSATYSGEDPPTIENQEKRLNG